MNLRAGHALPCLVILSGLLAPAGIASAQTSPMTFSAEELDWIENKQNLRVSRGLEIPPAASLDSQGRFSGYFADILQLIGARAGLAIEIVPQPSVSAALKALHQGSIDLVAPLDPNSAADPLLRFSDPLLSYPLVILTSQQAEFVADIRDLEAQSLIVVEDGHADRLLAAADLKFERIPAATIDEAIMMVASGQGAALIENLATVSYMIAQSGYSHLQISGHTPFKQDLALAVTGNNTLLLGIIQRAITDLDKAEVMAIRNKWFSVPLHERLYLTPLAQIGAIVLLVVGIILYWNRRLALEIGRRKNFERELIRSGQRFRDLFENNKAVELIVDPRSKAIVAANNAAIKYYQYSYSQIQQMSINDIALMSNEDIDQQLETARRDDAIPDRVQHRLATGEIRDVEVHAGPINWGGQALMYYLVHDITDRLKAERALLEAKAEAEAAARVKTEFLANMSHEIRTPMNSVLGMTELLEETPLNEEQRTMLGIVRSSGRALISIINDILDFSKLEANKMTLENLEFEFKPFVDEIIESFRVTAREKRIGLSAVFSDSRNLRITSDPTRVRQILVNLVANAIKFTDSGSVTLRSSVEYIDEANCRLHFEVMDTGIGLDADGISRLFDSFTQAEQSTTRKFGGTGLGLTITEKLVTLLDGSIEVESEPGKGSRFSVRIPVRFREVSDEEQRDSKRSSEARDLTRTRFNARILVAEDVKPNRILIEKMLAKFGLDFEFAHHGRQAVRMARENRYDLILMDCQMPQLDGYDATREIRLFAPDLPIVAVTANVSPEDNRRALEAGMNEVLTKPVQLLALERALQRWLEDRIDGASLVQQNQTIRSGGEPPILNVATLIKLRQEMDEDFDEIYQSVITSIEASLEQLRQHPQDQEEVTRLMHSIKSPAAALGAEQLVALAAGYEQQSRDAPMENLDESIARLAMAFANLQQSVQGFNDDSAASVFG